MAIKNGLRPDGLMGCEGFRNSYNDMDSTLIPGILQSINPVALLVLPWLGANVTEHLHKPWCVGPGSRYLLQHLGTVTALAVTGSANTRRTSPALVSPPGCSKKPKPDCCLLRASPHRKNCWGHNGDSGTQAQGWNYSSPVQASEDLTTLILHTELDVTPRCASRTHHDRLRFRPRSSGG